MRERTVLRAVVSAVALAVAFEAWLLLGTQVRSLMRVSPWQDDPYHAWLSLVVFALPALLAVTALRFVAGWVPWGHSSAVGRQSDLAKASSVLVVFVGLSVLDCWLSVVLREDRSRWDGRTTWLLTGLTVVTVAAPVVAWLCRCGLRAAPRERDADWIGDLLPARFAEWVRRHDRLVFGTASIVAAVAIVCGLAYGERWTDPMLIAWSLLVEVTCYYAFCVLTNAVLGFIERPDRDRRTERAVVIGALALQATVAMHGQLEPLVGFGSPEGVGRLVQVTVGPAVLAFVVALLLLRLTPAGPARPAR